MHLLDRSSKRKNISTATVVLEGSSQIPLASPRSRGLASAAIARSRSPDSSRTQAITDNETSVMMAERMNAFCALRGGTERRQASAGLRRPTGLPWPAAPAERIGDIADRLEYIQPARSEERRGGKECVRPGRSRWWAYPAKKKTKK